MNKENTILFTAFDQYPDFCFILNEKAEILDVNESFLRQRAVKKSEITGKSFEEIVHEASLLSFEHYLYKCASTTVPQQFECKLRGRDSGFFEVKAFLTCEKHGRSKKAQLTYLLIARDITFEKKREVDLLRFYYVAENTVNPLQITDLNGRMIYVNPAFIAASGYTTEELLGNTPRVFSSNKHSTAFWDNMWSTIAAGKVWVGEVENKRKDGEPFYTQLLISPIVNSDKKVIGYFGIHRDLHEKRNLERQLMHTQKMESIGALAAGVAHEVGNPLASISALVQIIQRRTEDEFIKEKLELVKKQITRISKIIRDLVDFSRPTNYEMKLTDINANIRESIEIVQVGKKAKDVSFVTDLDESLLPIRLVSDQIQQVFVNILINAVDAINERRALTNSPEKGEIKVSTLFVNNEFTVIFQDNGIGLKQTNIPKIFEPFFTTKTEGKGTGLGLWVSYGIVKSFQGDIRVESKQYEWTKFIINLPINPSF
ncbi:MAG: PAS domain S-box protein [Ignavibacteriales bacterium]|nr:PAS domain S-box protein [Ignavibacteriales bacterium]